MTANSVDASSHDSRLLTDCDGTISFIVYQGCKKTREFLICQKLSQHDAMACPEPDSSRRPSSTTFTSKTIIRWFLGLHENALVDARQSAWDCF